MSKLLDVIYNSTMELKVKLKSANDHSYKIIVQGGLRHNLATKLKSLKLGQKYAIITDSKVEKLYGRSLLQQLRKDGFEVDLFSFPAGEKAKTLNTVEKLAEQMIDNNFGRKDAIIALGGGVVGDLAGFLANIFMRGIPYIQIPTTLLAMVDSSVGGKTGVDLSGGKNLIGTFNQPQAVIVDPEYLKTLPINQIRNGLAEVIKYGIIQDSSLFKLIEQNCTRILRLDQKLITELIVQSVTIKSKIVEEDEKESNKRMILNYGHTYGHALEKLSNYTLLHGYAISIGMILANQLAVEKKLLSPASAERIKKLLKRVGLPITTMKKPNIKDLLSDKKRQGKMINFILPTKIGQVKIYPLPCL